MVVASSVYVVVFSVIQEHKTQVFTTVEQVRKDAMVGVLHHQGLPLTSPDHMPLWDSARHGELPHVVSAKHTCLKMLPLSSC